MDDRLNELAAPNTRRALLAGTCLLALIYMIPGLTGHDPWKQDEAYSFGIIWNMVLTGDPVVPTLAADPFMEKPPAYYITAAGLVRLLDGVLPAHDAARLASGLYMALAFWFTALITRATWGVGRGPLGVLLLIGTGGLIIGAHFMITDTALTAGAAMGCYGLLGARREGREGLWGGVWLGTGAGLAFMSKGLLVPGILGFAAILMLIFPDWRTRGYARALLIAALAAAPWVLIWPTALYLRSPDLFRLWFWDNNLGRFFGFSELGPPTEPGFWPRTVPWVTLPILPLAVWTLWSRGREALANPGVRMALVVSVVGWGLLFSSHTGRDLYVLPLLPVLAVVAAGGLARLPRPVVAFGYWFSLAVFGLMAAIVWAFWGFGVTVGRPPQWPWLGTFLTLDYRFGFDRNAFIAALGLQVFWVWSLWRWRPPRTAALLAWPTGLTLVWALLAILHLPWIEQARSYRGVFTDLRVQLPADFGCVADLKFKPLRECERGMLHYVTGITTEQVESPEATRCDYILTETNLRALGTAISLGPGWELIWQGTLPPVHRDLFSLFRRVPPP